MVLTLQKNFKKVKIVRIRVRRRINPAAAGLSPLPAGLGLKPGDFIPGRIGCHLRPVTPPQSAHQGVSPGALRGRRDLQDKKRRGIACCSAAWALYNNHTISTIAALFPAIRIHEYRSKEA